MSIDEHDVETRVRRTLAEWAGEAPVAVPLPAARVLRPQPASRRRWLVPAASALAVLVIALVATVPIVLSRNRHRSHPVPVAAQPLTPQATIAVGAQAGVRSIAVTEDAAWVVSDNDNALYRLDPAKSRVTATVDFGQHVEAILVSDRSIWVTGYEPPMLFRVDPKTLAIQARIQMPDYIHGLESAYGVIWAPAGPAGLVVVDPRTNKTSVRDLGVSVGQITAAGDFLWAIAPDQGDLLQIDSTGAVVGHSHLGDKLHMSISAGGALWVSDTAGDDVLRIDVTTGKVVGRVRVGHFPHIMSPDGDRLLVGNFEDGTMSVIDTGTNVVTSTTKRLGERIGGIAVGHGSIWIALNRERVVVRLEDPGQ